jgi:hypothetical protein
MKKGFAAISLILIFMVTAFIADGASTSFLTPDKSDGVILGGVQTVTLFGRDVAINQTAQRRAGFKTPYEIVPLSFDCDDFARVATAQAKLRNVTDTADVFANITLVSAGNARSTTVVAGQSTIQKGDILELQATTDGTGTITDLQCYFTYLASGVPDNRTQ